MERGVDFLFPRFISPPRTRIAAFLSHVGHVFSVGSKEQVGWIYTCGCVATVADRKAVPNRANEQFVGNTVGLSGVSSFQRPNAPIPTSINVSLPKPATDTRSGDGWKIGDKPFHQGSDRLSGGDEILVSSHSSRPSIRLFAMFRAKANLADSASITTILLARTWRMITRCAAGQWVTVAGKPEVVGVAEATGFRGPVAVFDQANVHASSIANCVGHGPLDGAE